MDYKAAEIATDSQRAQYRLIQEYGFKLSRAAYYDLSYIPQFPYRTPIDPFEEPFKEP